MTTSRAYLHACAASLPLLVGASAIVAGSEVAMSGLVAGVFALVSLATFELASRRFVMAAVVPDSLAGGLFLAQRMGALFLVGALLAWLGPAAVAIGFASVAGGALIHAIVRALHAADVQQLPAVHTMETPC